MPPLRRFSSKYRMLTGNHRTYPRSRRDHGVALIMVVFIVALATIIVTGVTYSTYIASRVNRNFERQVRAEYLLKSALNVARLIISSDKGQVDPPKDSWGLFLQGNEIPSAMIGISDPDVRIALEINAEERKLPLNWLRSKVDETLYKRRRDSIRRLFENLGFDEEQQGGQQGGPLQANPTGQFFSSSQMVANLIDYMDADSEPYSEDDYQGMEGENTKDIFPNRRVERLSELSAIPGFTPERVRKLSPFITVAEISQVNVNLTSKEVLRAVDESLSDEDAQAIIEAARGPEGPLNSQTIQDLLPNYPSLNTLLSFRSSLLQVIAKVQIGDSRYFIRSNVRKGSGAGSDELPEIQSLEFFG